MASLKLNLIAACDTKMGTAGVKNNLPRRLSNEMAYFNRMTGEPPKCPGSPEDTSGTVKRNAVIMGRKSFDSIPDDCKPLKNRLNIVLSGEGGDSEVEPHEDVVICKSWDDAMNYLSQPNVQEEIDQTWIIGGGRIYKMDLESPKCQRFAPRLLQEFDCDPEFDEAKFKLAKDPESPGE